MKEVDEDKCYLKVLRVCQSTFKKMYLQIRTYIDRNIVSSRILLNPCV